MIFINCILLSHRMWTGSLQWCHKQDHTLSSHLSVAVPLLFVLFMLHCIPVPTLFSCHPCHYHSSFILKVTKSWDLKTKNPNSQNECCLLQSHYFRRLCTSDFGPALQPCFSSQRPQQLTHLNLFLPLPPPSASCGTENNLMRSPLLSTVSTCVKVLCLGGVF